MIKRWSLGPMDNNTYLIVDEPTGEAAIVDPSFDSEPILTTVQNEGYQLRYILNTHAHFDHVIGNAYYAGATGAPIALHRADLNLLHRLEQQATMFGFHAEPSPDPTLFLEDEQVLMLGQTAIKVLYTPGHAPGHVSFILDSMVVEGTTGATVGYQTDKTVAQVAIVGDCLFARSIGRTDLPGGSLQTLLHSIQTRLMTLPDSTLVLPGHGALTTIGRERRSNPYLQP